MRSFAQPKNLLHAAIAALVSGLVCYPRLVTWNERGAPIALLFPTLVWAFFMLWGFVFAWHFQYSGHSVFSQKFRPKLWALATLCAIAVALLVHFELDPRIRVLTPGNYPTDLNSWAIMGAFTIAFEPLYLIFAPFAFFIRLIRKQEVALTLTVAFGLLILALRIHSTAPSAWLLIELIILRVLTGFAMLYLYLQAGALLVWWTVIILHLRFLLDLA